MHSFHASSFADPSWADLLALSGLLTPRGVHVVAHWISQRAGQLLDPLHLIGLVLEGKEVDALEAGYERLV